MFIVFVGLYALVQCATEKYALLSGTKIVFLCFNNFCLLCVCWVVCTCAVSQTFNIHKLVAEMQFDKLSYNLVNSLIYNFDKFC